MSKRGNPFPATHGDDPSRGVNYGTMNQADEQPQRATAAQLASRKMAAPKNKRATSRTPSSGLGQAFGTASPTTQSFPPTQPQSQNNLFSSQSFPAQGADMPSQTAFSSTNFNFTGAGGVKNPFAQVNGSNDTAAPTMNGAASNIFSTPSSSQAPTFSFGQSTAPATNAQASTPAFGGFGTNTNTQSNMFGQNTGSSGNMFGQANANSSATPAFGGGSGFGQTSGSPAPPTTTVGGFQFGPSSNVFGQQSQSGPTSTTENTQQPKSMFTFSSTSTPKSAPQQIGSTAAPEAASSNIFSQKSLGQNQNGFNPAPSSNSATTSNLFNFGSTSATPSAASTPGPTFGASAPANNNAPTSAFTLTPSPTEDAMHTSPDFNRTVAQDAVNDSSQPATTASLASAAPLSNFFQTTQDKADTQPRTEESAETSKPKEKSNGFKPDLFANKLAGSNLFAPKPTVEGKRDAEVDAPKDASPFAPASKAPESSSTLFTPTKPQSDVSNATGFTPYVQKLKANSGPAVSNGSPSTSSSANTSSMFSSAPKTNPSFSVAPATPAAQNVAAEASATHKSLSTGENLLKAPTQPSSRFSAEQQQRFRRNIALKGLNDAFRELIDQKQEWCDLSTIMEWYQENATAIRNGREPKAPSERVMASAAEKTSTKRKGAELTKETHDAASAVKKSRTGPAFEFTPRGNPGEFTARGNPFAEPPTTINAPNGSLFSTGSPVKKASRDESTRTPTAFGGFASSNKRRSPDTRSDEDTTDDSASKRVKAGDSTAVKLFESALSAKKDIPSTKSNFFQSGKFGTPSAASSRGTSVFDDSAQRPLSSANNIFGNMNNLSKDGSDKENQGDTDDEEEDDEEEEPPAKKPVEAAPTSNGGSDSETSKTSGRSLLSRTTFAAAAPSADATGDVTSADEQTKPFSSSSFSFGGDQTWKPQTPIKFGASKGSAVNGVSTSKEADKPPTFKFTTTSSAAETPSAETPKQTPAFSFTPKTTSASGGLFSGTSSSTPKFNFGSTASGGSQLSATANTPFSFSSLNNSRASTPGLSAGETSAAETSAAEGDDEAPKLEQQKDLCALSEQEQKEEEVLWEALKSRGKVLQKKPDGDGPPAWVTKGNGPLRILKNKQSGKVRIVMRAHPTGKLVLNVYIPPPPMAAAPAPGSSKAATLGLVDAGMPANWYFNLATPEAVSELVKVFNENRPST